MEVLRISEDQYSNKLTASGKSARWNENNEYILYTSSSRALATLEKVVNFNGILPGAIHKVMIISIADESHLITSVLEKDLPKNWRSDVSYSALRQIGSNWYTSGKSLILKVPSAIVTKEYNFLINLKHKEFKKNVKLIKVEEYFWDDIFLP
ncbi:MAG: RES family NAD+ phosphorylase [Bacteroidota bacterium]|nr:RES family NAD+ phosphorylase [Bacteroidota bacterium]